MAPKVPLNPFGKTGLAISGFKWKNETTIRKVNMSTFPQIIQFCRLNFLFFEGRILRAASNKVMPTAINLISKGVSLIPVIATLYSAKPMA